MRLAVASLCLLAGAAGANAQVFQIHDFNSTVTFDLGPVAPLSRAGMVGWDVNGVNQIFQQWFWFRTSNMAREERVNALPLITAGTVNTTILDPRDDTLTATFGIPNGLLFELRFTVQGSFAGDTRSDVTEQVRVTNHSNETIVMSVFQYADFDLGGDAGDDFVHVTNPNTVLQGDLLSGVWVSETVATPSANLSEIDTYPATLIKLDDASPDSLNGTMGPRVGRDDYTWAWQWNFVLQPNQSFLISKDKNIIPAPGAAAVVGLGLLALGRRRR